MKKILNIVLISIVLVTFILPSTHSCAIEEAFFEISELEVSKNDKIEMIINLNQIKYNKFLFELKASEDIENVEIGGNEITDNTDKITDAGLEVEKRGNEISIEVNKETNNLDSLILYYQVPQNLNVNDKIKFVATIANLDSNETESDTQTVEIEVKIIENTKNPEDNNRNDNKNQNGNNEQNNVKQNENVGNPQGTEQNNIEKNTDQSLNKEFSKENSTYFITVEKDVSSLEIIANADDEASSVCIYGNEEIADGTSKILISVTAENGNVRNYRIYVTKNS
ncbi:MAG: cadherin-like beta sandwich domain-containing protein [Clostridia bacterium]|jgi:hypothetical protein